MRFGLTRERAGRRRAAAATGVLLLFGTMIAPGADRQPLPAMPADHPPPGNAASKPPPRLPPDTVLARVDSDTITAADLDAAISGLSVQDRFEYNSRDAVRDLVEALIDRRLMARAARDAGMDQDAPANAPPPAARGEAAAVERPEQALAEAWLARELDRLPAPTEKEITAYYRDRAAEFTVPARVRVTRVIAGTNDAATRLRDELSRGASPDELRERHGAEIRSVEMLWLQDTPKKPELVAIALGLRSGEVSPVVPVAAGFAVLRAEETVAARLRPLADVRGGIAATLAEAARQQATQDMRKRLRSGAKISILEGPLMSYYPPLPGPDPGPVR